MDLKSEILYRQLRKSILSGEFFYNMQLPKEIELAATFGVGRITLRTALAKLEQDGLIQRIHGAGTFIAYQSPHHGDEGTILTVYSNNRSVRDPWQYILPGVERETQENLLQHLPVSNSLLDVLSEDQIMEFTAREKVVGVVAVMNNFIGNEPMIGKLRAFGRPVVLAGAKRKDSEVTGFASIHVNMKESWRVGIRHLLSDCGYRRIGLLGLFLGSDKLRGNTPEECLELIDSLGGVADPAMIEYAAYDRVEVASALERLLIHEPKMEAVLCFSDFVAIFVYEALKNMGKKIPDDLAVMGCCGFPDAKMLSPSLSTVDYEYFNTGCKAVRMILEKQTGHVEKEFKLAKRDSTFFKS